MNEHRFARIREIFHDACELTPLERNRFVETACAGDSSLRDEVNALFEMEEGSSDARLTAAPVGSSFLHQFETGGTSAAPAPRQIAHFRIVDTLGEGSMGIVFLAETDHPRRSVALKVLRTADFSPVRLRRFQREVDLLARLQHPGIARVYEAGVGDVRTAAGVVGRQPYFALERIEGRRLLEYCREQQLDRRGRLRLAAAIADAAHHAHCRGVVHRDLKPSNILVDASNQPKILDFGLSRATDDAPDASLRTEAGQILGTIAYAAPEQLRGDADGVDGRADVYSLGVMLFEMLTDRLPIDVRGLDLPRAVRAVTESEPILAGRLDPTLRGDLEAILSKALEKDRDRRYASAAEFAGDLRRHLNDEPISARPITTAVLLRKALRRHRAAVAAASLALVAALGGLSYGLLEARAQRDAAQEAGKRAVDAASAETVAKQTAQREARIATAVADFLNQDLLGATTSDRNPSRDMPLGDVLDAAATRLEGRFADEPLVEAAIRGTLGLTYLKLGDYASAAPQVEKAHQLREANLPPDDSARFETHSLVAFLLSRLGRVHEADAHYEQLVARCRADERLGDDPAATALGGLGWTRMQLGRLEEAETLLREGIECSRRTGTDPLELVRGLTNLGICLLRQRKHAEAEAPLNEAVETARRHGAENNADALNASGALAAMLNEQGKYAEAAVRLEAHLEKQRRVLGEEHPQTLLTQGNLAFSHLHGGRLDLAEPIVESTLEIRTRVLGEGHPHTLISLAQSALLRKKQERLPEAEAILRRGVELTLENPAIAPKSRDEWLTNLADVLEAQDRPEDARVYREKLKQTATP